MIKCLSWFNSKFQVGHFSSKRKIETVQFFIAIASVLSDDKGRSYSRAVPNVLPRDGHWEVPLRHGLQVMMMAMMMAMMLTMMMAMMLAMMMTTIKMMTMMMAAVGIRENHHIELLLMMINNYQQEF